MCNPFGLLSFAIGAAQEVMGYQAEVASANEQNRQYRENAMRANQNARDEQFQTQQRMLQEQEKSAVEKMDNVREAREAKATAAVAAGEAGVSGLSVDALLAEFDGRAASANDRVDQNTEWTMSQLNNEMKGIRAKAEDRINSVQRAARPTFFNTGLKIAGAGLDSYNTQRRLEKDAAERARRG